jgi:hypothetical protein
VCVIANTNGIFYDCKKTWTMCDCDYFVCVWLQLEFIYGCQHDSVCVVKAACFFCYLWLLAWVVCDCNNGVIVITKTKSMYSVFGNYFVCVIANTAGYFYDCKKSLNSMCLQLFCVRDCNQKLSVVAPWLSLCGWSYLVIYDCKSE